MRFLGLLIVVQVVSGQWLDHPTPGLPRLTDGKPNLAAPTPKTGDGKPDLSGVWRAKGDPCDSDNGINAGQQRPKYFVSAAGCRSLELPMLPWAREVFQQRRAGNSKDLPISACKPLSTPMRDAFPMPFKLVQTPQLILLLYEQDTVYRQVFMDGRKLPKDPQPSWLGYSVGRWDGLTLVIETVGFHDQGWLDSFGHPHSDALHMEERFRRLDVGHMDIQVTFTDSKTYTRPITFTQPHDFLPDTDVLEYFCTENEKDQPHMR
jgi:hypothetical protein